MNTGQERKSKGWRPFPSLTDFSPAGVRGDLAAGLTLAAIAIPEQMATARLGGFSPAIGLYAFVAASIGFAAFGSARQLSAGADSTITPIFAGGLAAIAVSGSAAYGPDAALLALMTGALVMLAGLFRLGWMADLLSKPVLTGFLAGIALHIVLSQAPAVLGLPEAGGDVYHRLAALAAALGGVKPAALAIGLGVFAMIFGLEKLSPRLPGALVALALAAGLTTVFRLDQHGLAVLGTLAGGAPTLGLPAAPLNRIASLGGLALITALVIMVQTAATTRAFAGADGDPDVNRDYVGMGAAGLLAGLAGTFPVDASPPRTAVVAQAGGRSQLGGLFAAALVGALVLFGAALLSRVPVAALGGVLLFVAQRIFRVNVFAALLKASWGEFLLAAATTGLIVALPIQTGVTYGVLLSLAHGVFTTTRTHLILFERQPGGTVWWPTGSARKGERVPGVVVGGFQAPLSFLNAYELRRDIIQALASAPVGVRLFVLEAGAVAEVDFTAAEVLIQTIAETRHRGVDFAVARLESVRAQSAFDRLGVTERLGQDHIFQSVDQAVRALLHAPPAA
ncbi:MAG TPA: SulP family inorganic anion transporter [Caulobacteraceae bacterium]|nr:SulP family inorganic anion transporter [Caulobacteraceae bacterium]